MAHPQYYGSVTSPLDSYESRNAIKIEEALSRLNEIITDFNEDIDDIRGRLNQDQRKTFDSNLIYLVPFVGSNSKYLRRTLLSNFIKQNIDKINPDTRNEIEDSEVRLKEIMGEDKEQ